MLQRQRIQNILSFNSVDKIGLQIDVSERGLYEHGEKLRNLFNEVEGDFGPISSYPIPSPAIGTIASDGSYHELIEDSWGVTWEFRIFKMAGHPYQRPLDDWAMLNKIKIPGNAYPDKDSQMFKSMHLQISKDKEKFFKLAGWINIFEKMIAVRRFEDVLADITEDDTNINKLADMIVEYQSRDVQNLIDLDVDAIQFADDFGMQSSLLISPSDFRRFFKPRYKELVDMVKKAGKKAFMHCCGYALPIIDDFVEIGFDAIWPQINVYDLKTFAAYCRSIGLAVAIHPDRAELMTQGTPDDICRKLDEYMEAFKPMEGGSWIYVEVDNGFPYGNIVALADALKKLRE